MKAIHRAKTKNDRIDSRKIAGLLRGGMFPMAYVYPSEMRATRDLMRRRTYLVRKRGDLLNHIQNTNSQWNLPEFGKKIAYHVHRQGVAQQFKDPAVRMGIEVNLELIDHYDLLIGNLERYILRRARQHDPQDLMILRSVHGIRKVLSLVITLRNPQHQTLPPRSGLRLLRSTRQVRPRIRGQTPRQLRPKDR